MRLFMAINFNDSTRGHLLTLQDELRAKSDRGNFSAPENLHLTLTFLGECNDKQTTAAKSVLSDVRFAPFDITALRVGRFKRDGGDIWWVGLREGKPLLALQRNLSDRLYTAGFALESRKFSPHITLGREVSTRVEPWWIETFGEMVNSIELMKSERIGGKLTYSVIDTRRALI